MKKGDWIYWRRKGEKYGFSYSFIEEVVQTKADGVMLHLTDGGYTSNPLRMLVKDLEIVEPSKP